MSLNFDEIFSKSKFESNFMNNFNEEFESPTLEIKTLLPDHHYFEDTSPFLTTDINQSEKLFRDDYIEQFEDEIPDDTINVALQTDVVYVEDKHINKEKLLQYVPVLPNVDDKQLVIDELVPIKSVNNKQAYVTLVTNDVYAIGAMVLGYTLRSSKTDRKLVAIVTRGVSKKMRERLLIMWDSLFYVWEIDSKDFSNLNLLQRCELGITFTKIHCWRLIEFEKCVFMDADTMVLKNVDDLFLRSELSAAPDAGWPDCFNSGVFVYVPSLETFNGILEFAKCYGSFDGGDQGLLNLYFSKWAFDTIDTHLSFTYNLVWQAFYSYQPAYKHFGQDAKVVHFIGPKKPWTFDWDGATNKVCHYIDTIQNKELLQLWWDIFMSKIQPLLSKNTTGLIGQLAKLKIRAVTDFSTEVLADRQHQYNWERNKIDYMGTDSFENIMSKLNQLMKAPSSLKATTKFKCVENAPAAKGITKMPCQLAKLKIQAVADMSTEDLADQQRQNNWERNNIDYMGTDSFENIMTKLNQLMKAPSSLKATTKFKSVEDDPAAKGITKRPFN